MTKLAVFAIVTTLLINCQGFPASESDIASAAAAGDWDEVHRLLSKLYEEKYGQTKLMGPLSEAVKNLKPERGGRVYGESEFTFHSSRTDENGQVHQKSAGHKILNDNGKITEYDFDPHPMIS